MKKLSVLFAAIIVLTLAGYGAGTAKAAPPIDRHQLNASQCSGGTLVVNVTQQVLNDIDSGYFGYWAQDNYTRQIQIWQLTENTFCVLARYEGVTLLRTDEHGGVELRSDGDDLWVEVADLEGAAVH